MCIFIGAWVLTVGTSCIKAPLLSAQEACAQTGLIVSSAEGSSVDGVAGREAGKFGGNNYQCVRPDTEQDMCEVTAFALVAKRKMDFWLRIRNFAIGVGYVTFLAPGVVLYFVFNKQRNDLMEEGSQIRLSTLTTCRDRSAEARRRRK